MQQPVKTDQLHRFLFTHHAIRGEHVLVHESYKSILAGHNYPVAVQQLLGELLVATNLLTATLKFDGDITIQLQGEGPLHLAVINGNYQQQVKGLARIQGNIAEDATLKEMIGNGYLVITITPKQGEPYQGIVGLEHETLQACLENYFAQSEQLTTRLFIYADPKIKYAAGMLLQKLPGDDRSSTDTLEHLAILTSTLNADELFSLPVVTILHRLYHEEEIRLFEPHTISFKCTCSRQRCENTIMALPAEEINTLINEDHKIEMTCDYCNSHYLFTYADINQLRLKEKENATCH